MTLTRLTTASPNPIQVDATVQDGVGGGMAGLAVTVDAVGNTVDAVQDLGAGNYRTTVTPAAHSREVGIVVGTVAAGVSLTASRMAIVMSTMSDQWNQPEAVPGLVNTLGYEDGPEVSPDGEWLIVSSYSFVDVFCCTSGCGTPVSYASSFCQTPIGPYAAPQRPGMFGASRVTSPTSIQNQCPKACYTGPGGTDVTVIPLVPVASFGFHRQADGSFAEPFVIGVDADGCDTPWGYSFTKAPLGNTGEVVMAFSAFTGINHLFTANLTLGQPNILGTSQCVSGVRSTVDFTPTPLTINAATPQQGNPNFRGGYLWYDNEYDSPHPPFLEFSTPTGTLPNATFSDAQTIIPTPGTDQRQPFFDNGRLYFTNDLAITSVALSGDPALPASWSGATVELRVAGGNSVGDVIALGESSVAHRGANPDELYFVYAKRTAAGGLDFDVGRVTHR